jgi:uncharacterized RDD family membrane protein YckC
MPIFTDVLNKKYDTLPRRIFARIIDDLIVLLVLAVGLVLIILALGDSNIIYQIVITFSSYFLPSAYYIYFHYKFGQTIGKKYKKLKLVDVSEERPITLKQAIIRDIVPLGLGLILFILTLKDILQGTSKGLDDDIASNIHTKVVGVWFILVFISFLFNNKVRGLHDLMAGTVLVKTDELPQDEVPLPPNDELIS